MITAAKLKTRTVRDLSAMARKKRVRGWHSMRKDQLIRALVRQAKAEAVKRAKRGKSTGEKKSSGGGGSGKDGQSSCVAARRAGASRKVRSSRMESRLKQIKAKLAESKDLASNSAPGGDGKSKDRLVVMVRDPYWLQVYWELTRRSIERACMAMGQHWHGARPVLRVHEVSADGTTNSARRVFKDVEIHGGVDNWYVDVENPPRSYQVDIGYLAGRGKFYSLARSNVVSTPQVVSGEAIDRNWAGVAQDYDRIYAMSGGYASDGKSGELKELFEERLRRPMGSPMATRFGLGAGAALGQERDFNFDVDAELIVYGATDSDAHVTIKGEPVRLETDGSFMVRFTLPNRRQVLPVVASSGDGVEQRTIVLAVERNTKMMEPVIRESGQ